MTLGVLIIIMIYQVTCYNSNDSMILRGLLKVTWSCSSGRLQLHQVAQSLSTEYEKKLWQGEKRGAKKREAEEKTQHVVYKVNLSS